MRSLAKRANSKQSLRTFDPLAESHLIRIGVERLERRRAGGEARAVAHELETLSSEAPWQAALDLYPRESAS